MKEEFSQLSLMTPVKEAKHEDTLNEHPIRSLNLESVEEDDDCDEFAKYEIRRADSGVRDNEIIISIGNIKKPQSEPNQTNPTNSVEALQSSNNKKRKYEEVLRCEMTMVKNEPKDMRHSCTSLRISYSASYKEKIMRLAQGLGIRKVSIELGIHENQIRNWLRKGAMRKTGSGRKPGFPDIEKRLYAWIFHKREKSRLVSVKSAQVKAFQIAKQMEIDSDFKCSRGWIKNFFTRYNLVLRKRTHKASFNETTQKDIMSFIAEVKKLIESHNYPLKAILNMDETPIFFECSREKTIEIRGILIFIVKILLK